MYIGVSFKHYSEMQDSEADFPYDVILIILIR